MDNYPQSQLRPGRSYPAGGATDVTPSHLSPRPNYALLLNRYRIMGSNESGGFGTVLTCWDTRLQRRVAIKRMPLVAQAGYARETSTIEEALAEARTSSMLAHPNIVTVFDFEIDPAYAYLVMEYVDGLTLAELLSRVEGGTLTGDECAYLVESVAKALQFAHDNGVLHLDIKPSNIMIDHSGVVKLCDFGMATLASAAGYGGARGGTVGYMPPEQIDGDLVDERCDVFSLAVVVWQSLTGSNPFASNSAEESRRKIDRGPKPALSKTNPEYEGMAEEALMQALDPNPSSRIPSIEAFSSEVSFGLGDSAQGADSIRLLMGQDEASQASEGDWDPSDLPLSYRYPWLGGLFERGGAALATAVLSVPLAPHILSGAGGTWTGDGAVSCAILCAIATAVAALWQPAGAALVAVGLALAIGLGGEGGAASVMLPAAIVALFLCWWIKFGTREKLSTPAVLLSAALSTPCGGIAPSAYAFAPLGAAATAMGGWFFATIYVSARSAGFSAPATATALLSLAGSAETWAALLGCTFSAAIGSAITRFRPTTGMGVFGQISATLIFLFSQAVVHRVKNGGIWEAPSWDSVGVAVVLCVLLCITTAIRGPQPAEEEVEDIHELA